MMSLQLDAQPVPLQVDSEGVARVAGTRITLDTFVSAFRSGATPEGIVQQYPSLALQDVYALIAYYLRAHEEVDAWLLARRAAAADLRREIERRFDPQGIRERLMARRHPDA